MTFSQKLKELRNNKDISQFDLAQKLNISKTEVENWELGNSTPNLDELNKLCSFFEVSADYFAGRDSNKNHSFYKRPEHIEYKSKAKLFGLPVVHINIGSGMHTAKGIIAIGTPAFGFISIGAFSLGLISLGALSAGLVSLRALSLGLLLSFGGLSIGAISFGGLSVGIIAVGGFAAGVYSVGGFAVATKIAGGGFTNAPLSIGKIATGGTIVDLNLPVTADDIKAAILKKFPETNKTIVDLFLHLKM